MNEVGWCAYAQAACSLSEGRDDNGMVICNSEGYCPHISAFNVYLESIGMDSDNGDVAHC
jgi:hypothetical protein